MEYLANNAASTLNGGIDNAVTSLVVANGAVFPATGNFRIIIDSELMIVGARSGNTLSSLTRGAESTSAASHSNGAAVTHVLTKAGLDAWFAGRAVSAASTVVENYLVAGDANPAFKVVGDGKHQWGAGGASALDTNLYRGGADQLRTDDQLHIIRVGDVASLTTWQSGDTVARFQLNSSGGLYWGSGSATADVNLYRYAANALQTDDQFRVNNTSGIIVQDWTSGAFRGYTTAGDAYPSVALGYSGGAGLYAGPGGASAPDCDFYRQSANIWRTNDALSVGGIIYADSSLIFSSDTNLYRASANALKTDDNFYVGGDARIYQTESSTSTTTKYQVGVSGDAAGYRFYLRADGNMYWGDGTSAADTNLYRSAADTLKSDDGIWGAGGLVTKTKAGVPSDTDLVTGMQQSGAMILDTTNSRIYFRVGSTWKYAGLT